MTAFIFLISFMLHIITFFAIAQLLKQMKQLKQQNHSNDIKELFDTYLQEIKAENRALEEKLDVDRLQTTDEFLYKETVDNRYHSTINEKNANILPPETGVDDTFETSLQARILQLNKQGLSHEEIAKMLNCGKTETELIIKLHAKNE